MKIAVYPGSFDPPTNGHLDIIKRSARLFDKVIVGVLTNMKKTPCFTVEERCSMIKKMTSDIPNIEIDHFSGLLVEFAGAHNATVIVRGLRAMSDFEYEFQMSLANQKMNPNIETVFLNTAGHNLFISSSLVKELAVFNGDISAFVPTVLVEDIMKGLSQPNCQK